MENLLKHQTFIRHLQDLCSLGHNSIVYQAACCKLKLCPTFQGEKSEIVYQEVGRVRMSVW